MSNTPQSRIASRTSFQRTSQHRPTGSGVSNSDSAAPPTDELPLSTDSVSLKPALPVGVVQAVHRLDHHPQVPEQTLLRNSVAPHMHRPSHLVSSQ